MSVVGVVQGSFSLFYVHGVQGWVRVMVRPVYAFIRPVQGGVLLWERLLDVTSLKTIDILLVLRWIYLAGQGVGIKVVILFLNKVWQGVL